MPKNMPHTDKSPRAKARALDRSARRRLARRVIAGELRKQRRETKTDTLRKRMRRISIGRKTQLLARDNVLLTRRLLPLQRLDALYQAPAAEAEREEESP